MGRFQITFFKYLTNSTGHPFKCVQGEVTVRNAASAQRAFEAAEHQFAHSRGVANWTLRADTEELFPCDRPSGQPLVHRAEDAHLHNRKVSLRSGRRGKV
jgi:hypothetical protein